MSSVGDATKRRHRSPREFQIEISLQPRARWFAVKLNKIGMLLTIVYVVVALVIALQDFNCGGGLDISVELAHSSSPFHPI